MVTRHLAEAFLRALGVWQKPGFFKKPGFYKISVIVLYFALTNH